MTSIVRLWDFSLALYRNPEVEQICLLLQDQWGANINLLLWLRWLEVNNTPVAKHQLHAARKRIDTWDQDVVRPLRNLRRLLKTCAFSGEASIEPTRTIIKSAELSAERVEQEWLEQLARDWQSAKQPLEAGANLTLYLVELQVPQPCRSESIALFSTTAKIQAR